MGKQITIKKCPKCGKELHNPKKFCTNCGHKLRFCPNCGSEYLENELYCGECGYKLSDTPKKIGETKPVSIEIPDDTPIVSEKPPILPAVKAQFENRAKQTENSLQMLSWNFPSLNFKRDFLNNLDNGISYRRKRRLQELRANFLNFINRPEPNYTRSLEELHKMIDDIPDNTEVSLNIAFCYQKMGNMNKVFETLIQARNVKPDSSDILKNLLGVSCLLRFWGTFLDTLRSYYKIAKDNDPDSHLLFDFELRFGFYENALQTLKDLLTLSDYTISSSLPDYLTLMAVRCLDDKTNSVFFKKITDYQSDINTLVSLLESKVKNRETSEYRAGKIGDSEALHTIRQKDIEMKSLQLYDSRQKHLQKNLLLEAKKVCEEIAQLRQEQRTKESYLYEGYLIEIKRLINAGDFESMKKAENLCWSIPLKERPEGWKEVNDELLSERKRYTRYSKVSINPPFSKKKRPVDNIMRKADKLAQKDPNLAISFLIKHENEFVDLADKIRKNNLLGHSCVRMSKFKKAMECYKFVLDNATQKQQKVGALLAIALIYRKTSDYQSAIDSLNNIAGIDSSRKAHVETLLAKIKEIKEDQSISEESQINDKIEKASNLLDDELLNTSRLFSLGAPLDEVSNFLEIEIEQAKVEGLTQKKIENKEFSPKDIEYLQGKASEFVRGNKPKPAAEYFLSAVKVLYFLESEDNDHIAKNLKNYCAAKGDAFIIENTNWDVARTYYFETFRFSTNFVFSEKEFFDPNETLKAKSEIKLSQFLSTFHRTKEAFLGKSDWPIYNLLDILQNTNKRAIISALNGLILLASYNPEVGRYLLFMAKHKHEISDKLCHYFSEIFNKEKKDKANYEFLEEMINLGVSQIRDLTQRLMSRFQFFDTNLSSFAQLREKTPQFLDGEEPSFKALGVDFHGTDSHYFQEMKTILRSIESYDSVENFDERESKFLTALQFINTLIADIDKSPTYWGRAYMLPLVQKWKYLLEEDFRRRDEQASPKLLIETVERAEPKKEISDIHVLVSNKEGTRTASGIKLHILPSLEESYSPVKAIYEIGSIRIGQSITKVISIRPITDEGRLTLNYQISYDRKGEEVVEESRTISVSLAGESFEEFKNPYTTWANASIVTEEKMFKGRTAFVDEIFDTLKTVGKNKTIVIHGQKRSGKSSILYHVARKFENDPASNFLPVELDMNSLTTKLDESTFFHTILTSFEAILMEMPQIPSLQMLSENPVVLFINYMKKLNQLPLMRNCTPLLIIDEFTELYSMIRKEYISENFMRAWKSIIDKHLFSVLLIRRLLR